MLFYMLISVILKALAIFRLVIIVQFLLSLAIAFNVLSTRNPVVRTIWDGINALLEPFLGPIRRALPYTGNIDFSPLILIMIMSLIAELLGGIATLGF